MTIKGLNYADMKKMLAESWKEWNDDNAPRLGASLAYYTILSIAPLLVVIIAIAGLAFGKEAAEGQIYTQIQGLVGDKGALAIQSMIQGASKMGGGIVATIIGVVALLFGATSVVIELRSTLNAVWHIPPKPDAGVTDMVKDRGYAIAIVLGCGFLLLVSLVASAAMAAAGKFVGGILPIPEAVMHIVNLIVSFLVITGIFALLFKFLPDVNIAWDDVILGAAFTSLLFTIGKFAIGLYLGKASFGSSYGAAGSLLIVLVWVYYSAQILFFGAEFTQVYAREHGSDPMKTRSRRPAPPSKPQPASVHDYASSAASGNTALPAPHEPKPSTSARAKSAVITTGMIAALFAAAANELRQAIKGRRA